MTSLEKGRVHVLRSSDPEEQRNWFRNALKSLVKVKTKEVIAIKPNLGSPMPACTGATTELWMIEETINYVRKKRAKPIIVEAPSHIHDYDQVLDVTGARELFDRLDVEYVDARVGTMALRPLKHDSASGHVYHVSLAALSADGIIALPKLKTHNRTDVSLGIKGFMGFLDVPTRHQFHRRGVHEDIVELYKRLADRVRGVFVDGLVAMEGHGPTNGSPVPMNVIVGGTDTVSVDSVCAQIMGFDQEEIHHIRDAHYKKLGNMNPPWVVHPAGSPLPVKPFERPRPDNGFRTQLITLPPISAALRAGKMGVRGRTKPVLRAAPVAGVDAAAVQAACPTDAIGPDLRIEYERCIGCRICVDNYPGVYRAEGRRTKLRRVLRELTGV